MGLVGLRAVAGRALGRLTESVPDGELLERFVARRDEAAFAALVARHGPKVFAICRRAVGHHHLAEDAFQATFLVLAKKAHAVRPRSSVGGFLYGVARRAAVEAYAVSRRRKETLVGEVPDSVRPAAPRADADVLAMLDEEIANLSDAYRAAVVLCELDGVGRADAARQLGIAEGTLSSRLAAARKQLAGRLKKRGVLLSSGALPALAASAGAAVPPAVLPPSTVPASVSLIANRVLRAMTLRKLKAVALGAVVLAFLGATMSGPNARADVRAAPVPKAEKDDGHIWTYHFATGELACYTPGGVKEKTLRLRDGMQLLGLAPDGRKIAFVGKRGRLADPNDRAGLTVHLRGVDDRTDGTDTGIEYERGDQFHWSNDGTRVVRVRRTSPDPADPRPVFRNTLIDLGSKTTTPIDLPDDPQQVLGWSPDDAWLQTWKYSVGPRNGGGSDVRVGLYRYDWQAKTTRALCDSHFLRECAVSPDGRTLFGVGLPHAEPDDPRRLRMVRVDVAAGTATDVAHHKNLGMAGSRWSPGGRRVAYLWYDATATRAAHLVLCDPDGRNAKSVVIPTPDGEPNRLAILGWFPSGPAAKSPAAPSPRVVPVVNGLIWTYNYKTGELVSYSGTERVTSLRLADGRQLLGLTPDGGKIAFVGIGGKLAKPKAGPALNVHLRDIGDATDGHDTGIQYYPGDQFQWSHDGKRVIRVRPTAAIFSGAPDLPAFNHTLIDVETKRETPTRIGLYQQALGWSPDGKWVLLAQYSGTTRAGNVTNYRTDLHRYDVEGRISRPVGERLQMHNAAISPDGCTLFGVGCEREIRDAPARCAMVRVDIGTGKVTEVKRHENQGLASSWWSPDGKRVAYVWGDSASNEQVYLVVSDPDGRDADTVVIPTPDQGRPEVSVLGWFPAKPK